MRVGFTGAGNIAAAMARGWDGADGGPELMLFTDAGSGRAERLAEEVGGEAVDGNRALAEASDLVVLGVKPRDLDAVASEIGDAAAAVLSLLAATPLATVSAAFPGVPTLRAMPSLGVEVRRGSICLVEPDGAPSDLIEQVRRLLSLLGTVVPLDDGLIDAATAVMGCAPAYLALTAEAIADSGTRYGLDSKLAHELVTETMAATAELLRRRHPADLRAAVASPGGATEAGLEALAAAEASESFAAAVEASLERMRQ
jgi:pyrroline-5-carboxylate reductase